MFVWLLDQNIFSFTRLFCFFLLRGVRIVDVEKSDVGFSYPRSAWSALP